MSIKCTASASAFHILHGGSIQQIGSCPSRFGIEYWEDSVRTFENED
jgi:hypothetical protein